MTNTVYPVAAVAGAPLYNGRMLRQVGSVNKAGATPARPLGARSGVRPGTSTTTCTATSTTWVIGPHAGTLDVQVAAEAGPYDYALDANVTGSVTPADGTNPRVDILWMRCDDPPEDSTSVPLVAGGYTAGGAAPTPAAPSAPARCMILAKVNVPKVGGGAPTVTWCAPYTVAAGGILPAPDSTAYPLTPRLGQYVDDQALGVLVRWNGSIWAESGGSRQRQWEVARPVGADAGFTTPMTGLAGPTVVTGLPAGAYRITGRLVLYSAAGVIGNVFVTAGAQTQLVRHDLVSGSSPRAVEISMSYQHAGGALTLTAGYDVASGTAVVMSALNQSMVRAEFLGA